MVKLTILSLTKGMSSKVEVRLKIKFLYLVIIKLFDVLNELICDRLHFALHMEQSIIKLKIDVLQHWTGTYCNEAQSTAISNGRHPSLYIYMIPIRLRDFVNTYFKKKHACLLLTLKVKTVTYTESNLYIMRSLACEVLKVVSMYYTNIV